MEFAILFPSARSLEIFSNKREVLFFYPRSLLVNQIVTEEIADKGYWTDF